MRAVRRNLVLATVASVGFLMPAAAFASVQQGSANDAPGDQVPPDPGLDIAGATAVHNTGAGTTVSITINATPSNRPSAAVRGAVGVLSADGETCSGRVVINGALAPGAAVAFGATFDDADTPTPVAVTKTENGATITLTTPAVRPGGGEVDCAFARTYDAMPGGSGAVYDTTGVFRLQTDTPPPPPPPPPTPPPPPAPPAPTDPGAPEGTPALTQTKKVPSLARAKRSYIYGICGFSICRVDPVTRRSARVQRATTKTSAYTAVSTSLSGAVMAFTRRGKVVRAGRDGRGSTDYGPGSSPAVRIDGRAVAFERTIPVQSPPFCTPDLSGGPLQCTFTTPIVPTPTIFYRSAGASEAEQHGSAVGTFAWSRDLLVRTTTESGSKPAFVCATTARGACARAVAQEPTRALNSQQSSPDGRLIVAVAEPAPARNADDPALRGALVLYDAATGAKLRDLTTGTQDAHPAFSPDGRQVAFARGRDLYVMKAAGGTPRLIRRGVVLSASSWSLAR